MAETEAAATPVVDAMAVELTLGGTKLVEAPPKLKLGAKVPSLPVPRCAKELTPEWLTKALRFRKMISESASVVNVAHKPIGDGVMGDISAVTITYSGETTAPRGCCASSRGASTHSSFAPAPCATTCRGRSRPFLPTWTSRR